MGELMQEMWAWSLPGMIRDVRVQILNLISDLFVHQKPHFQTFNALKSTSFQPFQIISDLFLTDALTPLII